MAKELIVKTFDPNKLFYKMVEFYQENKKKINPNTGTTQRIDICCEGSSRCFDGNQRILCSNGSKLISEIKKGDKVYSYDHKTGKDVLKTVNDVIVTQNKTKKCLKIKLKNGNEINCTEDHEIFYNGRYILAKELVSLYNELKNKDNDWKAF